MIVVIVIVPAVRLFVWIVRMRSVIAHTGGIILYTFQSQEGQAL